MYVCMYVCILSLVLSIRMLIKRRRFLYMANRYARLYAYAYVYACMYMYAYACICTSTHTSTHTHTHTHTHTTHTHTHKHTHTHTHRHTHARIPHICIAYTTDNVRIYVRICITCLFLCDTYVCMESEWLKSSSRARSGVGTMRARATCEHAMAQA
jgi:hypothetical protein